MWLVMREGLLTNAERFRCHMSDSGTCQLFHREDESVLHVLRDCPRTRLVWSKLLPPRVLFDFMLLHLKEWISVNINLHSSCSRSDAEWSVRFAVFCWLVWKRRCSLLLDVNYVERGDFVAHGLALVANFLDGFKSDPLLRNNGCVFAPMWSCPRLG
ncbi:hypothetical protein V6N12_028437 [Hibiscus sabdariffa]|uniref:Reverse transcriptase zinc-binding domain-containing protein n=1 Tax=Hibiscus sabdariffa TaxID=183260 RepID=A0ABR2F5W1_9ROSI